MAITRGTRFENKRTGRIRTFEGTTTKPNADTPSDGVRRARLVAADGSETRIRVDQLDRQYRAL